MLNKKLVYLATPYSKYSEAGRQMIFEHCCRITAEEMKKGVLIFSQIAHSHMIVLKHGVSGSWDTWAEFDKRMIEACDTLLVLALPGWPCSVGVLAEIRMAHELHKEVLYGFAGDYGIDSDEHARLAAEYMGERKFRL